jgi:hypothetical protein
MPPVPLTSFFRHADTVALLTSQNLLVPSFCNPQTSLGLVGLGVQTTLPRVAACSAWYAPEDVMFDNTEMSPSDSVCASMFSLHNYSNMHNST